jgi:hypothetical protein
MTSRAIVRPMAKKRRQAAALQIDRSYAETVKSFKIDELNIEDDF